MINSVLYGDRKKVLEAKEIVRLAKKVIAYRAKQSRTFVIMTKDQLVIFDGICNLCNGTVHFIIKRDRKKRFLFTT